jgi:hypothetical protein
MENLQTEAAPAIRTLARAAGSITEQVFAQHRSNTRKSSEFRRLK